MDAGGKVMHGAIIERLLKIKSQAKTCKYKSQFMWGCSIINRLN